MSDLQLPNASPANAPQISDADDKRTRLRNAKRMATSLLAVAVVVLIAARAYPQPSFVAALIRAAAEAAIVGGLADWFAVVALFRHPLGIPIPHTALIPSRKDEIGRSLGHFVSEQFLAPELLIARLREKNRALQIAQWLARPDIAAFIAGRIANLIPRAVSGTNDAELRRFFANLAHEGLRRIDLRPTVDAVIDNLVRGGKHLMIADAAMDLLQPTIVGLRETVIARVSERTGRFVPRYFDRKIAEEMLAGVVGWLEDARTPDTDERLRLETWMLASIENLRAAPDYDALIARAKDALVNHPALVKSLGAIWDELKREILTDAATPQPRMGALATQLVQTVGRLMAESPAVQQHFNAAIESALVTTIAPWRRGIGGYIAEIVTSWDGKKVAELIELQVGRDLQYIRVNGTLAGALIGATLFLLGSAIPVLRRLLMDRF